MKRKYLAILMGIMVASTTVPATAFADDTSTTAEADNTQETTDENQSDEKDENTILGEVKSVSDTGITIAVGTRKEMGQPGDGQAPDKPDGDSQDGQAPEKPDGDSQDGQAPSMLDLTGEEQTITITENTVITHQQMGGAPDSQPNSDATDSQSDSDTADSQSDSDTTEALTASDIQEGDTVSIVLDDEGNAATITIETMGGPNGQGGPDGQGSPDGQGGPGGDQSQGVDSYTAVNEYTEDTSVENTSLESTGTDENAALVSSGANVSFDNVTVSRDSQDSTGGNDASFYGVGAAVLATDGTAYVKGGSITTDANGGAGLFAYGDGTIYAADTDIKTEQGTSGGVHAAKILPGLLPVTAQLPLSNEGTIVDDQGKTVTIQGTDGTVYVEGDSQYTITTGSYSDSADLSGATTLHDWSGYQTEKPSEL